MYGWRARIGMVIPSPGDTFRSGPGVSGPGVRPGVRGSGLGSGFGNSVLMHGLFFGMFPVWLVGLGFIFPALSTM